MRRSINIKLLDNNEYSFAERNKEDADLFAIQQRLKAKNIELINQTIKSDDDRLPLLVNEMKRTYSMQELTNYLSSAEERILQAYDSFKINNNKTFDEFKKLVDAKLCDKINEAVNALEVDEVKKKNNPAE